MLPLEAPCFQPQVEYWLSPWVQHCKLGNAKLFKLPKQKSVNGMLGSWNEINSAGMLKVTIDLSGEDSYEGIISQNHLG